MSEDVYCEQFEDDVDTFEEGEYNDQNEDHVIEAKEAPVQNSGKQVQRPTRVVRNPQPKLNAETLKGKRGLTSLPSYFDRIKYKGRGYEEQDLMVILKTYEYWCHRLFPKYPFDECISKIEKLGSKRPVQTFVKKIRLDMIHEIEPVLLNTSESEEENLDNNFDQMFNNIPSIETQIELTEEQEERIKQNKEKAEKLRQERVKRAQERSESALRESNCFLNEHEPVSAII